MRAKKAVLALENGDVFRGWSVGAPVDAVGEAVFNTGMAGYEEIVTDPSYSGQFVTLTSTEIGNYGTNKSDMESRRLFLSGLIVHELNEPANRLSEKPLNELLKEHNVPAIAGIDTRRLTLTLRSIGTQKAFMHCSLENISDKDCIESAKKWGGLDNIDSVSGVTTDKPYAWSETGKYNVIALDYGVKYGILRNLAANDMKITVLPASTSASEILAARPDGVFLSNGPGDPGAIKYAIECAKNLIGKVPIMGICLGHQILGIAMGAKCARLKFGHHGCNHPVKNLETGAVEITSQNHNFAVQKETLPPFLELTHINLNDNTIEGMRHKSEPVFSVQYHPEACPGPNDSKYLFNSFKKLMER